MSFKNVKLLEEEIKEYQIPNYRTIKPKKGTIDREKNIKLFKYWTNIDDPYEKEFVLVWDEVVIDLTLKYELVESNTCQWCLKEIVIPKGCSIRKEDILTELRKAIMTYGVLGFSDEEFRGEKAKIIVKF